MTEMIKFVEIARGNRIPLQCVPLTAGASSKKKLRDGELNPDLARDKRPF